MPHYKCLITCVLSVLIGFLGNCYAIEKLPVFVSIVPQKYFVQQIGGQFVDVRTMVRPGASPATYEPKPKQMADLSKTQIYLAIGVPFESVWLEKISASNPHLRVVHTDHGVEKLFMAAHHHDEHEETHLESDQDRKPVERHDKEAREKDHHERAGLDPHIWLSPPLVKIQARNILTALQEVDPAHKTEYEKNFKAFASRIDQLDAELKIIFAGQEGLQFLVFHPAWGYFAHTYGLKQVPIEIEGKDPKPAQLNALIAHAKKNEIKVIFIQPQFSTKSAELVAREIGGQVVFADPLAENWMVNMRQMAKKFRAAFK